MELQYASVKEIKSEFNFLLDLGFSLVREEDLKFGSYVEFVGNGIKIYLGFDFKNYNFLFDIYKGEDLKYSDEAYGILIKPFYEIVKKYNLNFSIGELQPSKTEGYKNALHKNAVLLEKYGDKILCGKEWF